MTAITGIVFFCVVVGGLALLVALAIRKDKKTESVRSMAMDGLASALGGRTMGQNSVELERRRHKVEVHRIVGKHARFTAVVKASDQGYPGKYTPLDEETWDSPMRLKHQPQVTFTRESMFNKLGKVLFINREVQTGDGEFDEGIYINSSAPDELVHHLLRRPAVRRAIVALLGSGWTTVEVFHAEGVVRVNRPGAPIQAADNPQLFEQQLELMTEIAAGLPAIEVENPTTQIWTRAGHIATSCAVLGTLAFMANLFTTNWWPTLGGEGGRFCVTVGLVLWLFALPVLILSMRGFSNSFSSFFLAGLMLLFGLPSGAALFGTGGNALFDGSRPTLVNARVLDKRLSKSKNSTSYYVEVDPGAAGKITEFKIDGNLYSRIDARVTLKTHKGAFGWTWVDKIVPAPR